MNSTEDTPLFSIPLESIWPNYAEIKAGVERYNPKTHQPTQDSKPSASNPNLTITTPIVSSDSVPSVVSAVSGVIQRMPQTIPCSWIRSFDTKTNKVHLYALMNATNIHSLGLSTNTNDDVVYCATPTEALNYMREGMDSLPAIQKWACAIPRALLPYSVFKEPYCLFALQIQLSSSVVVPQLLVTA